MSEVKALPAPKKEDTGADFFGGTSTTDDDGMDFFKLDDKAREQQFNDFVGQMSRPREPMEAPGGEELFEDDFYQEEEDGLSEEERENLQYFDYTDEHRNTALFFIGALDSTVGIMGSFMTGQQADNYQAFAQSPPPDYFVNAAAALVKKHQATLSPEGMVLTGLAMIYAPVGKRIMDDRSQMIKAKKAAKKQPNAEA